MTRLLRRIFGTPTRSSSENRARPRSYTFRQRLMVQALEERTVPNTYTVSNLNDLGAGSLSQAITDANANPGADVIDATGVSGTITLMTELPFVTDSVSINGPGSA